MDRYLVLRQVQFVNQGLKTVNNKECVIVYGLEFGITPKVLYERVWTGPMLFYHEPLNIINKVLVFTKSLVYAIAHNV